METHIMAVLSSMFQTLSAATLLLLAGQQAFSLELIDPASGQSRHVLPPKGLAAQAGLRVRGEGGANRRPFDAQGVSFRTAANEGDGDDGVRDFQYFLERMKLVEVGGMFSNSSRSSNRKC